MNKYRFTIKHDNGKTVIILYADSLEIASRLVMNAEACPERAIVKIEITSKN